MGSEEWGGGVRSEEWGVGSEEGVCVCVGYTSTHNTVHGANHN